MIEIGKNIDFDFFLRFLEGIQRLLGDKCEIVIHDYRKGKDHTVVYIINGELSGRSFGGATRGVAFAQAGEELEPYKDGFIFFYKGHKDKYFKSCTTFIADENQKIIGSVCFNIEVTEMMDLSSMIQSFLNSNGTEPADKKSRTGYDTVDEMLHYYVQQSEMLIGKPKPLMTKEEKIKAIGYLDEKGIFKISKANVRLCEEFQISKFTLYNYLEESRRQRGITDGGEGDGDHNESNA